MIELVMYVYYMYSLSGVGVVREEVVELAHIEEWTGLLHRPHILLRLPLFKFQRVEKQQRLSEPHLNPQGYFYKKEYKIKVLILLTTCID